MKKNLTGVLFAVMLLCTPLLTHAATAEEIKAMIAALTAQLGAITSGQGDSTSATTSVTTVTITPIDAVSKESNRATLKLSYDSLKKESALNASQQFVVKAGNQDVYVMGAGFKLERTGSDVGVNSSWIPNGTTYTLIGTKNATAQQFTDINGNVNNGWLVKAGTRASFGAGAGMNPQLMFSGIYTDELSYVQVYSGSTYGSIPWKRGSLPSNKVTIVGEKNATPVVTALAKAVGEPTLKLTYDSKHKEALLEGGQNVDVKAGSKDILVSAIYMQLNEKTNANLPHGTTPNGTNFSLMGVGNTKQETLSDSGSSLVVWRVKAGQVAHFKTKISVNPNLMAPGVYTVSAAGYVNLSDLSNQIWNSSYFQFTTPAQESQKVTIVGDRMIPGYSTSTPIIKLTSSPVVSDKPFSSGQKLMDFRVTYDPIKFQPTSVVLSVTCPQGVDASFSGETSSRCVKNTMNKLDDGTYDLSLLFTNTNSASALVGAMAQAYNIQGVAAATDKDAFNLEAKTTNTYSETGSKSCSEYSPYTFTQNLTVGSQGSDVVGLQCLLNAKGYLAATYLSGYFGPMTKAALAGYEVAKGISPAEGYFGPKDRAVMNAETVSATTVTAPAQGPVQGRTTSSVAPVLTPTVSSVSVSTTPVTMTQGKFVALNPIASVNIIKGSTQGVSFTWATNITRTSQNVYITLVDTTSSAVFKIKNGVSNNKKNSITGKDVKNVPAGSYKISVDVLDGNGVKHTSVSDGTITILAPVASLDASQTASAMTALNAIIAAMKSLSI